MASKMPMPGDKGPKKQSAFQHDYPDAKGLTKGGKGAGVTPHKHPYDAGVVGDTRHPRSDAQGPAGPSSWPHDYDKTRQPGHPRNLKGSARVPLTHFLRKRSRGVAKAMGKRM